MGFLFKIAAVSQNILLGNSQTCFPAWDFWTWEKLKPFYNAGGIAWDAEQPGNRTPECSARRGKKDCGAGFRSKGPGVQKRGVGGAATAAESASAMPSERSE